MVIGGGGDTTHIYTHAHRRLRDSRDREGSVRARTTGTSVNGRHRVACQTVPRPGRPRFPTHPIPSLPRTNLVCPRLAIAGSQRLPNPGPGEPEPRDRSPGTGERARQSVEGGRGGTRCDRLLEAQHSTPMAASSSARLLLLPLTLLAFCVALSHQQSSTDSCGAAKLAVANLVPFDSTAFRCTAAWKQQDFVLRYKNTGPSEWSFVLSAPDKGSYVAVGFSGKGAMVGSSAVVGWVSNGKGTVKQYYLGGKSPDECTPNKGLLKLVKNRSVVVSHSGRLYLAFQLSTDYPQPHLIYAVGPDGNLPPASTLQLPMHQNMASRSFNYTSGMSYATAGSSDAFPAERKHGLLGMMGWGVLMPIGMITARYFRQLDPCWFYSHMAIQVAGFALGIAAIVLGFRLNEDGLKNVDVHKALGIAILAMASLQVMAILARPDKTSKVRRFWNWYHHNIGRAAILLAIGNIFLGLSIAQEISAYIVSYGVFVAVWVVAIAAFEMKRCYADDD